MRADLRVRGAGSPTRMTGLLIAVVLAVVPASCAAITTAPARTYKTFVERAVQTATSASSAVSTTQLAASAGADGKGSGPYLSVLIGAAEDSLGAVTTTFEAILPPDERSDRLREQLAGLLSSAGEDVSTARIAIRRGERQRLSDLSDALERHAERLTRFADEHK